MAQERTARGFPVREPRGLGACLVPPAYRQARLSRLTCEGGKAHVESHGGLGGLRR